MPEHAIISFVNAGIVHRLVYQPSKLRRWVRFPLPAPCKKAPWPFGSRRFCFALSVPLIAQGIDLVGKLGKVFVCAALVVLDDPQQALAGADQPLEHTGRTALAFISLCLLYTSDAADE